MSISLSTQKTVFELPGKISLTGHCPEWPPWLLLITPREDNGCALFVQGSRRWYRKWWLLWVVPGGTTLEGYSSFSNNFPSQSFPMHSFPGTTASGSLAPQCLRLQLSLPGPSPPTHCRPSSSGLPLSASLPMPLALLCDEAEKSLHTAVDCATLQCIPRGG